MLHIIKKYSLGHIACAFICICMNILLSAVVPFISIGPYHYLGETFFPLIPEGLEKFLFNLLI